MSILKQIETKDEQFGFNLQGLWHGTVSEEEFSEFDCRGLGVHIGTYEQAKAALEELHDTTGRLIQINAQMLNSIRLPDMGSFWSSPIRMITEIAKAMGSESAARNEWDRSKYDAIHAKISDEWDKAFLVADKTIKRQRPFDDLAALKHECATRLVLQQNGFDGIVYANQFEGVLKRDDDALSASPSRTSGDSYIIFTNSNLEIVGQSSTPFISSRARLKD
jgi:hypothetical protein